MKRFYLSGQKTFDNRGCEAIVRSTVRMLNQHYKTVDILVPSDDISRDSAQWPDAHKEGVRFVPSYFPFFARFWVNLQRLPFPLIKRMGWPFPMPRSLRETFSGVDAVLSVGGDNYSLDYRLPSPLLGMDRLAMDTGTPVVLWGASVGPFESEPHFIPIIKEHLKRMCLIAVRESVSESYLRQSFGLTNVIRVADPAFTLRPEQTDMNSFWPADSDSGVLGVNISPLLNRYRHEKSDLIPEVASFLRYVIQNMNMSILLVPHVVPLYGNENNNDSIYLKELQNRTGSMGNRIRLMDSCLNAAQIKYVVGRCRYFIGARTHSTIAAISSCVPTISIAYSVKAKGINRDIFDHGKYVLETPAVNAAALKKMLNRLVTEETHIRSHLKERMGLIREKANLAATQLKAVIQPAGDDGRNK
ncbi:MAG: polysaccharide pyruvyl transferase family protein [Desulfobacteraceae bacterium]|jgi:colanic acid/amylovoran biosynthesis protein|nr:polysaccharide pyruvyl transferase family protein [Desulfobacteraceae bacterium]